MEPDVYTNRNAFASYRLQYILYQRSFNTNSSCFHITRDEVIESITHDGALSDSFVRTYTFLGFAEVARYILNHADTTKAIASNTLRNLDSRSLFKGISDYELDTKGVYKDPYKGRKRSPLILSQVSSILNSDYATRGYGLYLTVSNGYLRGTYIVVRHFWTEQEKRDYTEFGNLPFIVQSKKVKGRRYVVLYI